MTAYAWGRACRLIPLFALTVALNVFIFYPYLGVVRPHTDVIFKNMLLVFGFTDATESLLVGAGPSPSR